MTTDFDRMNASSWESLAAVFGRSVEYLPHGADTAITIRGIFKDEGLRPDYSGDSIQGVRQARLKVAAADVPNPDDRDSVMIGGAVWAVGRVVSSGPVVIVLELQRRESRQVGGSKGILQR